MAVLGLCARGIQVAIVNLAPAISFTENRDPDLAGAQWTLCTNWSHGTISAILDSKKGWNPPLGHRKPRKAKLLHSFAIQYGGFCTM